MSKLKSVLLVEDDPNDVDLMRHAWSSAAIINPLEVVNDGQQAVDYLGRTGEFIDRTAASPCLVLLDIKLPYLSGLEVIQWLRSFGPCSTLNVVFLTSSNNEVDIDRAYKFGGNAYLVKPPTLGKLIELVKDLKEFWIKHNQFPPDNPHFSTLLGLDI